MALESRSKLSRTPQRKVGPGPAARMSWLWIACAVALLWLGRSAVTTTKTIPYSEFKQHLARGELEEVFLQTESIVGTLRTPPNVEEALGAPAPAKDARATPDEPSPSSARDTQPEATPVSFRTVRVEDPDLIKELEAAGVAYTGVLPDPLAQVFLTWILPLGLLL